MASSVDVGSSSGSPVGDDMGMIVMPARLSCISKTAVGSKDSSCDHGNIGPADAVHDKRDNKKSCESSISKTPNVVDDHQWPRPTWITGQDDTIIRKVRQIRRK